jgi:hypothetical protein
MNIPGEEWMKTLEDGRKVKFVYQELPEDGAFITAQLAAMKSFIRYYWPKQETRLVAKMLKVVSRASFRRSSDAVCYGINGVERISRTTGRA